MSERDGLAARVEAVGESPTMAITARARALRAEGVDVIGFGAGEPDAPTPAHVVEAAQRACADPAAHRYGPAAGDADLREAIAQRAAADSGLAAEPSQVVVTNGAKHALFATFQALLDPGDEVLIPAPHWVSYPEQVRLAGGVPVSVPTDADAGFAPDVEQLEAACTERTRALVVCSPSNPTGTVLTAAQLADLGRFAAERGLWVIADEIYEHLVYGDAEQASLPVVAPEAAERCVVINGVAKTYAMTGWRVGWAIAPPDLAAALARHQSHATSNVCAVAQRAALAALTGPMEPVERMRADYDRRRRIALEGLAAIDGVACYEPKGAFYAFPSVEGLLGRSVGGQQPASSADLCAALLEAARVALVPGEGFGAPGHVRLSYCVAEEQLREGLDRIAAAVARG